MLNIHHVSKTCILGGGLALALLAATADAKAPPFQVVHTFNGTTDGSYSYTGLLSDKTGNFYGTASSGGTTGDGTVFKIAPDGTETVLYTFANGSDGATPYSGVISDKAGNLYGTTYEGAGGYGTVYEIARDGTEIVLYRFTGGSDGGNPESTLVRDKAGNLYGTTTYYGTGCCNGTVFKLAPDGTETTLYDFTGGNDGGEPAAGVIMDKAGNLYGTTVIGGSANSGVVFKVAPNGTETVLYTFTGGNDGGEPVGALISDKAGNLYGTASGGGTNGNGTVFEVAANGTETTLHSFRGGTDGSNPEGALHLDKSGNLFGTTVSGGANGAGTVFEITAAGTESILYSFTGGSDGAGPYANLTLYKGHLYSTTSNGGSNNCPGGCGVVFSLKGK